MLTVVLVITIALALGVGATLIWPRRRTALPPRGPIAQRLAEFTPGSSKSEEE